MWDKTNAETGIQKAVSWEAEFSTDDGTTWSSTKPEWLTAFTANGDGSLLAEPCSISVKQQIINSNPHIRALQEAPAKGTVEHPYNLSNRNGSTPVENTANCYVVGASGTYSFPLVYGNAIKNGGNNEAAYTSTKTGKGVLKRFVNHQGEITSPYINDNGCEAKSAELVWQDALSLITDIRLVGEGSSAYVSFNVEKETIQQGNAVIAVKDESGQILWSWHIWVTDEDINAVQEITNHREKKYKLMSVDLGWCNSGDKIYNARKVKVKFSQKGSNKTKMITISQEKHEEAQKKGNAPYYQWGRKDPFLPSRGTFSMFNKIWYNAEGKESQANPKLTVFPTGKDCITYGIQHPDEMNGRKNMHDYNNLWNMNCLTNSVPKDIKFTKTIYDPSPVGFHLPNKETFTGFTTTGEATSNPNQIKGSWIGSKEGWSIQGIFIPFIRRRYFGKVNGGLYETVYEARWVSTSVNADSGGSVTIVFNKQTNPLHSCLKAGGIPVRAIQEE